MLSSCRHPTFGHRIIGDGNCLFRAFSYIITGAEDQHFELRCRVVEHFRSVDYRLIETAITAPTVQEYIANSGMDQQGAWGGVAEMFVLASMVGANVYSYRMQNTFFEICTPGVVIHPDNYGAQSIILYILYTGDQSQFSSHHTVQLLPCPCSATYTHVTVWHMIE